jgi:hypothetical protein
VTEFGGINCQEYRIWIYQLQKKNKREYEEGIIDGLRQIRFLVSLFLTQKTME